MKFCSVCQNMYYPRLEDGKLMNVCLSCMNKEIRTDFVISSKNYKGSFYKDSNYKKYLKYDPALQRTIHYDCPNEECPTHKDESKKEAVIENEGDSLVNVYICCDCGTEWKYS